VRILRHGVVDSTSERAFEALAAGQARHFDVHVAEAQTAGRGSRGRAWHSAPGEGLYASVVLLSGERSPPAPALTMAAGLAVRDLCLGLGLGARLKWPNDTLVGGKKIAGVLIEARGYDPTRPAFVCGIGLNVGQRAFPPELEERGVTSLALEGLELAPEAALLRLLPCLTQRLDQALGDPEGLTRAFAAAAGIAAALVRVQRGAREERGRVAAFSLRGIDLSTAVGRIEIPLEHVTAVIVEE
jgi:BirA family biotin operon repressor/biotin-[acetyl-CoA-carboxylase] ligase